MAKAAKKAAKKTKDPGDEPDVDAAQEPAAAPEPEAGGYDRAERSELERKLASKKCPNCGQVGVWRITRTVGAVRYIKCTACQANSSVRVAPPE